MRSALRLLSFAAKARSVFDDPLGAIHGAEGQIQLGREDAMVLIVGRGVANCQLNGRRDLSGFRHVVVHAIADHDDGGVALTEEGHSR